MPDPVKAIPDGGSAVIPRLFYRDPIAEIEFCARLISAIPPRSDYRSESDELRGLIALSQSAARRAPCFPAG